MMSNTFSFETVGDLIKGVQVVLENHDEAQPLLDQYVDHLERTNTSGWTREECLRAALANIGYVSGYINMEALQTMNRLLGATHISFGAGV